MKFAVVQMFKHQCSITAVLALYKCGLSVFASLLLHLEVDARKRGNLQRCRYFEAVVYWQIPIVFMVASEGNRRLPAPGLCVHCWELQAGVFASDVWL